MEYMYASLILHETGKEITEEAISNILSAAGIIPDKDRTQKLIAVLEHIDIDEAIKIKTPAIVTESVEPQKIEEEPEPEPEEDYGLSKLFG